MGWLGRVRSPWEPCTKKDISEIVDVVRSCIPQRAEKPNLWRDFWMPDQCRRVCYECDSQFTIFNRRYHCRICGQVFCVKCTANSVPVPLDEPRTGHEVKVCNFCFKQREHGVATVDNETPSATPCHSSSQSATSLASSSGALGDLPSKQFDFCFNRSDDEEDDDSDYHLDMESMNFDFINDYDEAVNNTDIDDVILCYDSATGEWGYLRSSTRFGLGEHCSKGSEDHRKAMKNVAEGQFRALIAWHLEFENLPVVVEDGTESWLEIITALSWEAASLLKLDMSQAGRQDPSGHLKVKCIASGKRSESMVMKEVVVCNKKVAHCQMKSKFVKPHLLILGGALECGNPLSSDDTSLQQEMECMKMALARIDARHPNVLLVENSVSQFAQEYLLHKNISVVPNIQRPLLERIAHCTGAEIVPSIDHLSSQKLGYCETFHVEKYFEEHSSAGQGAKKSTKTLMFFEGCPKPLGCTILLKGANRDELKKVKHLVQYGVFAVNNLALETSFLTDEGETATLLSIFGRCISTILDFLQWLLGADG